MSSAGVFPYFWLGIVVFIGLYQLAWAIRALQTGVARWNWLGAEFERSEQPVEYWMTVIGLCAGVVVACFLFWFGLDMFRSFP